MLRFRQIKSLQNLALAHANVRIHFKPERQLVDRKMFKHRRSAALANWREIAA